MKKTLVTIFFALWQIALFSQTIWEVDTVHSSVRFSVAHLGISEIEGAFRKYSGTIIVDKPDLTDATIEFKVDVNSLDTDNDLRDKHLKGSDFFDAEKFPNILFKSTSFKKIQGNKYQLNGNLTIRDITKPVKFSVFYGGTAKDGMGNTKSGYIATTAINRFDYGLNWNKLTETGTAVVGKNVSLNLKLEFAQKK